MLMLFHYLSIVRPNKRGNLFNLVLFFSLFMGGVTALQAQGPVHDPTAIIKGEDDRYYVFSTGDGVYALSSSNPQFSDFREEPTPLNPEQYPAWIDQYVTDFGGNFWAPGVIYMNGYYYLYYSASSFGSSRSAIGVTRTPTLANPQWEDQGLVVSSNGNISDINAIDPALFRDDDDRIWMSYGSFFGGIAVVEIDPETGKTMGAVTKLAGGNHQDYEAPYILKNDGYYYLFINRGKCCQLLESTYYVEVSRSTSITGPYSGTRQFLSSQQGHVVGPGHIGYRENTLTYHYYDGFSNGYPRMLTTTLSFENGWPVAGSNGVELAQITGTYALVFQHSQKAITIEDTPAENGSNLAQHPFTKQTTQYFEITHLSNNWHSIRPQMNPEQSFDVFEISVENGANINLWEYWGGNGQQFAFEQGPGGYYLINRNSNRCVEVGNASQADGANVIQWGCFENGGHQLLALVEPTPTSLESNTLEDLQLHPNPSKGSFTLSGHEAGSTLTISNLQGQIQGVFQLNKVPQTLAPDLDPGLYLAQISKGAKRYTLKLIIQ